MFIKIGPVKACMFTNIDHISQKDIKIAPSPRKLECFIICVVFDNSKN